MTVILALWTTLTWAITYMVMSYRHERNIDVWAHHLREADLLIDQLIEEQQENY
jgi:hypothetical protein